MASNIVAFECNVPVQLAVKYPRRSCSTPRKAGARCFPASTAARSSSIPRWPRRSRRWASGLTSSSIFACDGAAINRTPRAGISGAKRTATSDSPKPAPLQEVVSTHAATGELARKMASNLAFSPLIAPLATSLAHSGWALAMKDQTETLINLYAGLCRYANEHHGDVVSRDDVRALLMQRLIGGGRR